MKSIRWLLALCCVLSSFGSAQYLEATIEVGGVVDALLWNPVSNKLYCTDGARGRVVVVDGAANETLCSITTAEFLSNLVWNSRENKVYCADAEGYRVFVIDGVGDSLLRRVNVSPHPSQLVYDDSLNKLYAACYTYSVLTVIDGHVDTAVGLIPLPSQSAVAVHHPRTHLLFAPLQFADSTFVVDCCGDSLVRTLPVGRYGAGCWNPVNDLVYIVCDESLAVLSARGDSILGFIPGTRGRLGAVPCPNRLYTSYGILANELSIIDCRTNTEVRRFPMRKQVGSLICDTIAGKLYCADCADEYVDIYDAWRDSLIGSINVGRYPGAVAWNVTNRRVYVAVGTTVKVIREDVAVEEPPVHVNGRGPGSTFVRSAYWLSCKQPAVLLDISGREVAQLHAGANDVGKLSPGVYFVREAQAQTQAQAVCRVVVVR
jgi:DNA-binding beta-propeller fold protein YncE